MIHKKKTYCIPYPIIRTFCIRRLQAIAPYVSSRPLVFLTSRHGRLEELRTSLHIGRRFCLLSRISTGARLLISSTRQLRCCCVQSWSIGLQKPRRGPWSMDVIAFGDMTSSHQFRIQIAVNFSPRTPKSVFVPPCEVLPIHGTLNIMLYRIRTPIKRK